MSGNVSVSTPSVLFPLNVFFPKVSLTLTDGNSISFVNVTKISMTNYNSTNITSNNITLSNGKGFYSLLSFGDNVTIKPSNNAISVSVLAENGNTPISMNSVKIIEINYANSINLVARQPKISVQGKTIFTELYSLLVTFSKDASLWTRFNCNGDHQIYHISF